MYVCAAAAVRGGGPLTIRAFQDGNAARKNVTVKFAIKQRVDFGKQVAVVGSSPKLGAWDVSKGIALHWQDQDVWEAAIDLEGGEDVELKFVIRDDKENIIWQPIERNLAVKIPTDVAAVVLEAHWKEPKVAVKPLTETKSTPTETKPVAEEPKQQPMVNSTALPTATATLINSNGAVPTNWEKLTLTKLKDLAKTKGLSTAGKKADIVNRIKEYLNAN